MSLTVQHKQIYLFAVWLTCLLPCALAAQTNNATKTAGPAIAPLDENSFRQELTRLDAICAKLDLVDERKLMAKWFVSDKSDAHLLYLPIDPDPLNVKASAPTAGAHANWLKHFSAARTRHAQHWFESANQQATAGDEWSAYNNLWRAAREDSQHPETKRVLGTLATALNVRGKPRPVTTVHPKFGWPNGSYSRMETANFKITSRAEPGETQRIAAQLEAFYVLWTQAFYPLWAAPGVTTQRLNGRNTSWQRKHQMEVVLCKNREDYLKTLGVAESNIGVSVGYYSPEAQMSFFYPDESLDATLYHELTHQLISEVSQLKGTDQPGEKNHFWLIEAVSLYMESLVQVEHHWRLGGWLAERMQGARYRAVHDGYWVEPKELDAIGFSAWKEREDISRLYVQSSGLAHFFMDRRLPRPSDETSSSDSSSDSSVKDAEQRLDSFDAEASRVAFFSALIAAYRGDKPLDNFWQLAGEQHAQQDYLNFQLVRDRHIQSLGSDSSQFASTRELVLTRSRLSSSSWQTIGQFKQLNWLDLSNSNATANDLRWLKEMTKLQRLSLEGIAIDQTLLADISQLPQLKELDLSMCNVDDQMLTALKNCKRLETLFLTGNNRVSSATVESLEKMPGMKFIAKP